MSEQLPLGLGPDKALSFDNFYTIASNRLLLNQLRLQAEGEGEQWVLVHGAAESGRSHLLQASCQLAANSGLVTAFLPLVELKSYDPEEVFAGSDSFDLLCVDDIDAVVGRREWDEALFHLYNRASLSGTAVLFSSRLPASSLDTTLSDLRSRLNGFSVYHLAALSEEQRLDALIFRASKLGMELSREVAEYLYHRAARNLCALFGILEQLDRESMRHQRALTKPFVKKVMAW